jgi:hypothetical protein
MRLNARDIEILATISDYRYLTAPQVKALFFRSIHVARRRLFKIWQNKFLERVFLPPLMGNGSPSAIYCLARKGVRTLVLQGGLSKETALQTTPKSRGSYLHIEHALRRNDFRIALTLACRDNLATVLMFWRQDKLIKASVRVHSERTGGLEQVSLFPDGFFGLRAMDKEWFYFLEIDRGTVNNRRMELRYRAYYELWQSKLCLKTHRIPNFRVLTVTTAKARMESLMRAARHSITSGSRKNLFMFTTFDKYGYDRPKSILDPIWDSAALEDNGCFSLLGRPA